MHRRDFIKAFAAVSALVVASPVLAKLGTPSTPEIQQSIPVEELESRGYSELEDDLLEAYNDYLEMYPEVNDDFTRKLLQIQLDDVLVRYRNQHKITQYKIVCDERNNPISVIEANDIVATIMYHKTHDIYPRQLTLSKDQ